LSDYLPVAVSSSVPHYRPERMNVYFPKMSNQYFYFWNTNHFTSLKKRGYYTPLFIFQEQQAINLPRESLNRFRL
jgi:hypothetical protein